MDKLLTVYFLLSIIEHNNTPVESTTVIVLGGVLQHYQHVTPITQFVDTSIA
jgi:hypothetical protein